MKKFKESLLKLNKDEEFHEFISAEEDARKRINTLVHNAKDEGIKEKSIDIAKKLIEMNMNFEDISNATGLTTEEIEKLSK